MLVSNLWRLCLVSISYLVLIYGLSAVIIKPAAKKKTLSNNLVQYFIIGNFYVMNVIFLLMFLKCTSRFITIVALIGGAFLIRFFLNRKNFKSAFSDEIKKIVLLTNGSYGWRLYRRERFVFIIKKMNYYIFAPIKSHIIELVGFLGCMIIQFYYIGYRFVCYSGLGIPDEATHLEWIQGMLQGDLFFNGVYPYGMHNIIYAMIQVFGFKAFTVVRYFGFIVAILVTLFLYLLLKKVCRSRYAPFIGLFLYIGSNMFHVTAWDRIPFALPEEFAILFLYPLAIYLFYYLRDKRKNDLYLFGICFALTLYSHYYVSIIALFICLSFSLSRFIKIIKEKLLVKLLIVGIISTIIGMVPVGIGYIAGYGADGSIDWAIGVIKGEEQVTTEEGEDTNDTSENQLQTDTDNENVIQADRSIYHKLIAIGQILKKDATDNSMRELTWTLLMASFLIVFVNTLIRNIFRVTKDETFFQFGMMIYVLFLLVLLSCNALGLPEIIQNYRVTGFLSYAVPIFLCMPFELVYELSENRKWTKVIANTSMLIALGACVFTIYTNGDTRTLGRFRLRQSEGAVKVIYDIFKNFNDKPWNIVSPVDEYSIVVNSGQHFEWIDLLGRMGNFNKYTSIYLYEEDVFFFVEKIPIGYNQLMNSGGERPSYMRITTTDARSTLSVEYIGNRSQYYEYERDTIMAKAYYWAEKYKSYFPKEMSVYYEDDNFICYHLKQNPYYLNNLAIDYGYNPLWVEQE